MPNKATRVRHWSREQALAWIATRDEQFVRLIGTRAQAAELRAEPGMLLAVSLALTQAVGSPDFGQPVALAMETAELELSRMGASPFTPKAVKAAWPSIRGRGRPAGKTLPRDRLLALAFRYMAERCVASTVEQHEHFCSQFESIDLPEFRRLRTVALAVAEREIDAGERLGLLPPGEAAERRARVETWKPRTGRPPGRQNVQSL